MGMSGPSLTVLRGFIEASNAQYRTAGLDRYQMRLHDDGTVTVPDSRPREFKPVPGTGGSSGAQARAGARQTGAAPPGMAASPGPATDGAAQRTGAAPLFTSLKATSSGFALRWEPVPGAASYGVYVDGQLVGHVPRPAFGGSLAVGAGGTIQVDAVAADGTRTHLTAPMHVSKAAPGRLQVTDPRRAVGATAPAAAVT
jgi:hypothetical protein